MLFEASTFGGVDLRCGSFNKFGVSLQLSKKYNGLEDHTNVEESGMVPKSSRT
jgi:hypothetical protein